MKVVFMGTPDFARESLKAIFDAGFNVLGVVTNEDKKKGRGMKLAYSPVKEFALEEHIAIYQPAKVKNNQEFIEEMKELEPDVICVVAYGKILPKEILEIPKLGCINVHGSLLPKYRGAAPIQWAVLNGDKTTGITTMYMDEGMDTGDMIEKEVVKKYYGFDSDRRYKQDEIADIFGYTQSYTSRILKRTNEKIKVKYLKRMT